MKRHVFTIPSVLSLLLSMSVLTLWAASYGPNHDFMRLSLRLRPPHYAVRSANGWIGIYSMSPAVVRISPTTLPPGAVRVPTQTATQVLAAPHWAIAGLLLVPPAIGVRAYLLRRRERFRRTHGLCLICGYDLRASEERCPECGVPIPGKALT